MRFLSVKRCDLMRKTSEAVVFGARVLFALVTPGVYTSNYGQSPGLLMVSKKASV